MNSQDAAQFSLNAFHRAEIVIGSGTAGVVPDRTQGQYFEMYEGTKIFVERCDFPVQLSLGQNQAGTQNAFVLRDGLEIDCNFKGFTLQHPPINVKGKLSLLISKKGADTRNQYADPYSRILAPWRIIQDTAALSQFGIYIPPGSRLLPNLQLIGVDTTLTRAVASYVDNTNSALTAPSSISQNIAGTAVVYNSPGSYQVGAHIENNGTNFIVTFPPLVLPVDAVEVQVILNGTGLVAANDSLTGNFQ